MSEPIQAIATNNYILAAPVGSGYMETSALEYDGDKISGYAGSAFKAGDEFPQSATEAIETVTANSADWNGTTETVSSNSGVWGGSALPVSAGKGVKISLQNDTLVFSNDEAVLWEGDTSGTINLSESPMNFERIKVFYNSVEGSANANTLDMGVGFTEFLPSSTNNIVLETTFIYNPSTVASNNVSAINHGIASYYNVQDTTWNRKIGGWTNRWAIGSPSTIANDRHFVFVKKVIGINRIAGGN